MLIAFSVLLLVASASAFESISWNDNEALGCFFRGNDLGHVRMRSELCRDECAQTEGCTHFTWTTYNEGTCWMKSGPVNKADAIQAYDLSMICGLRELDSVGISWNGNWAHACDFRGNDMGSAQVRGQDCGGKCEQTSGCTHYTWTTFNGGTCWMKSGRVSKSDAFDTGDQSMICGVTGSSPGPDPGPGPKPSEVEFRVINRCPFTIWPGIQGRKRSDPNWRLPFNGGWELGAGQTSTFGIPKDFNAGRIWARTNCRSAGNQFPCETGFCGFKQCAFDGVQRGGQTPASLAEFTLSANGQDYYDVSLVDGYNLKISIIVRKPNSDQSGQYWCKNPVCTQDLNQICPDALKKRNSAGQVVGCLSACEVFKTDQYCCRGAFNQPHTCKSSTWPVNYPSFFKKACPMAYSYAYDDATSTFFCRNTGYDVVFC